MRSIWLISRTVLLEAIRRKEIYAITLVSLLLLTVIFSIDFFQIEGLMKFYREVALKIMSMATALTVIVLSSRQLPREFENKTIYPLMAKPLRRTSFLSGKLLGVILAALFCFSLFMFVYIIGTLYVGGGIPWSHFLQYIYLQLLQMMILTTLGFLLSLVMNLDAAITLGIIFYITANILITSFTYLYDFVGIFGKTMLTVLTFIIPQLALFDFSGKTVHSEVWPPLDLNTLAILTAYAFVFSGFYYLLCIVIFRRRAI
ncbi:ABC transporter permease subunit [Candidatus Sumerlaeota bacterium]|nr:ABC transporter permease subunit [Candidatus Sumerlaeota bacterium]